MREMQNGYVETRECTQIVPFFSFAPSFLSTLHPVSFTIPPVFDEHRVLTLFFSYFTDNYNFSWFCLNEGWSHCAMSQLFPKKLVEVSSAFNYLMLHLGFKISISSILHPNTQCNSLPEFV
jgi:hypothetical protein